MGVHKRERANGRHVYQVSIRCGGKTYFETSGTDKRVADRLDQQRKREVKAGTYVPASTTSGSTTILAYAAEWFRERGNRSKKDDAQRMRDHILPRVGSIKLQDLSRRDVKDLISALVADERISVKTAKNAFGVFRTMIQEATDNELIHRDPCSRLPRGTWPADPGKKRGIYERAEVVLFTTSDRLRPGVRVLLTIFFYTGAREGEGCGLKWRQWKRDAEPLGQLAIDWAYDHQPLKLEEQPRRVPVHPVLADVLDWWWREGFALTYGRAPTPNDFIVPRLAPGRWNKVRTLGASSECHTKSSCYKAFARACETLGIECRTLHSTRHTMITAARRGDQTGRLAAPLEKITHNAKGQIIDCYTHWEWEPLCEAIMAISYVPPRRASPRATPSPAAHLVEAHHDRRSGSALLEETHQLDGGRVVAGVDGGVRGRAKAGEQSSEFVGIFVASQTATGIIGEFGGGAGNRTRGTDHDSGQKPTNLGDGSGSGEGSDSRQFAQVDANLAARQNAGEPPADRVLEALLSAAHAAVERGDTASVAELMQAVAERRAAGRNRGVA